MTTTHSSPIRIALLSVSDKTGLVPFARRLASLGVTLWSTGGTAAVLRDAGLAVTDVSEVTGFPEMMDGRVKTLHPKIHGGLLAVRDDPGHRDAMTSHDIDAIDLLVVNLYPFEETVARGADAAHVIENIDIGGPAMLRSAAKNHRYLTVVVDPADYDRVLDAMAADGTTSLELRRSLATKTFAHTAAYDAAIADWFALTEPAGEGFPSHLTLTLRKTADLRYGENPHQQAALYQSAVRGTGIGGARQIQGKELSYNNINDADAALELIGAFADDPRAAVAIIKHANPCGVAVGASIEEAYRTALRCDPVSAFGGIVVSNRPLDAPAARAITDIFTEVVAAPDADADALKIFAAKKNLRLLLTGPIATAAPGLVVKSIIGGWLAQTRDLAALSADGLKLVTERAPSAEELDDLLFAFRVAKYVKSNAIVYARGGATVGIGAGQMSRVDSARIAGWKGREAAEAAGAPAPLTEGSVVASDAFFPFADGLEAVAANGATAVIQPGGSMRDAEVIAAADRLGLAMLFTGVRHFRH